MRLTTSGRTPSFTKTTRSTMHRDIMPRSAYAAYVVYSLTSSTHLSLSLPIHVAPLCFIISTRVHMQHNDHLHAFPPQLTDVEAYGIGACVFLQSAETQNLVTTILLISPSVLQASFNDEWMGCRRQYMNMRYIRSMILKQLCRQSSALQSSKVLKHPIVIVPFAQCVNTVSTCSLIH